MNFYQLATYTNRYAKLAMIVGIILLATQILVSLLSTGWFWFLFMYCVGLYLGLATATFMFTDAGDQEIDQDDRKHFMIFGGILCIPYVTMFAGIVYAFFGIKALHEENYKDMDIFKDAFLCRYEEPEQAPGPEENQ